ncbi:MAG: hypothetical protein KHY58_04945 [Veillonella parvula]|uniref:hypothetical protein n=1 Tax=Veillonella parvula TaxID=29466 RepID=UPI00241F2C93|nr:hypothetical protein [Veillonella parvula]MBS5184864.1 hypothetical protein [Veillonella parvula]
MKLRLFAATLAVMALGTTSIMAEDLQKTSDTPLSIVESQKDSASILPEQYKSYATKMNTVVKDYKNGYMFSIPWRVADGVMLDMDVRSESEHIQGYSFNLAGPTQEDSYTVSFTKRNNTPQEGISQKEWNTTWYGVPIKGMSNEEYLNIWRQHSNNFEHNDIVGGFFAKKGAVSARWDKSTPKSYADMTSTEPVQSVFEAEFIMEKDPTHRYNLSSTYAPVRAEFMELGLMEHTIPSFELINKRGSNAIKGVKKILTGTSDISVAEGIKFTYPKGFTRLNEKGKIAFTKHNIRLDIESFTIPVQAVSSGMPTMMGKQMLGDYYLKQLVDVNKATITRYETHIIDGNVMFYLAGHMKNPNTSDTAVAEPVSFGATIILGNEGNVAVARMIGPSGSNLATQELIDVLDGFRLTTTLNTNQSSQVL